jgi:hypothetical protein
MMCSLTSHQNNEASQTHTETSQSGRHNKPLLLKFMFSGFCHSNRMLPNTPAKTKISYTHLSPGPNLGNQDFLTGREIKCQQNNVLQIKSHLDFKVAQHRSRQPDHWPEMHCS